MKILQRYVVRELTLPFLLSALTLSFIFMAGYLVKAANYIISRGVPLFDTLYILFLALPGMVSYTVPMGILTAVLVVYGSLSQNNEIRAMKASGIHLVNVVLPVFLLGLLLSFIMFVFNDQIATNASFELRRASKRILIKHPMAIIEPGRFVKLSDSVVFLTKEVHGSEMHDIVAYEHEEENKPVRTIVATRGEVVKGETDGEMQIRLYDGSISDAEDASVQSIQFKTYEFPTIGQEDIRKMQKKMKDYSLAELLIKSDSPDLSEESALEVWSAFNERIAFSFGCLMFIIVGIPVAILVQRGEMVLSFGISMAAASLYYIGFVSAKTLSLQGILPAPISYWMPNLAFIGLGVYLLRKAIRV